MQNIMESVTRTPRRRVANFTADEKALLAQLIKKRPIVESKVTDGKSVAKKQVAWDLITQEFNCNVNVHKRETITLKRAWDNMKAVTRKARATERGNLIRTGGGPCAPPLSPQHGAIISMVEEAAPVVITEIKNPFDSDGTILNAIDNSQELTSVSIDNLDILNIEYKMISPEITISEETETNKMNSPQIEDEQNSTDYSDKKKAAVIKNTDQVRRPTDYIRREAVIRIKHLENKKKMEMQILKTQLEVDQIKKKAALLEEERNKGLLKTQLEVDQIKKKAALLEEERNKGLLKTQDAAVEKPTEDTVIQIQNDVHSPPDHELFPDPDAADDGSGVDPDESSGSGWGAGPGPDDEDGRGSGDEPNAPPDDEDYGSTTTNREETERTIIDTPITPEITETDDIDIPEQPEIPIVPKVDSPLQIPTDPSKPIDVLIPNTRNRPSEGTSEEGRGAGEEQPSRPDQTDISISGEDTVPSVDQEPSGSNVNQESRAPDKVVIMNAKPEDRATSFFAQPGILAAVIGGAVVGLLCAILVVMFIVYRMRKKDEGSYALDEPKRSPAAASYGKGHNNREFYA